MKITHLMLIVTVVVFAWLTTSYVRPVPASSYEHAKANFLTQDVQQQEVKEITLASAEKVR